MFVIYHRSTTNVRFDKTNEYCDLLKKYIKGIVRTTKSKKIIFWHTCFYFSFDKVDRALTKKNSSSFRCAPHDPLIQDLYLKQ